ncbi:MAG: stage V sporulation protein AD [Lachnospiraceae bacterium]|jgi:stage V sporulation protein AD|nr:stage V sporulation protein AD [Lachnospiraceae bacterium]
MDTIVGKQSIQFQKAPYIVSAASVVGKKEGEGPLGSQFDEIEQDPMVGQNTWEEAESALQKRAAALAMEKMPAGLSAVRYLFSGDLLGQLIATSFGVMDLKLPLFGLYGACSTIGEALMLAAMTVQGGYSETVLALTSSHFGSAEKQFRFPLEYGGQRPLAATWTVTGSGAFVLAPQGGKARISGATPGKVVDFGLKDSLNMGACMAPAACDTICQHLEDFGRQPSDYDYIITGDLGSVGQTILLDLTKERGYDLTGRHLDCGMLIYDSEKQDTHAGGSGCACSAVTLAAHILPKIEKNQWKRVLFVPTGALLSTVSYNEGQSVPGIAHGVVIEHAG